MTRSLFVTGASGFIGSALLRRLEPDAYDRIHVLSRRWRTLPAPLARSGNIHLVQGDLDDASVYGACLGPDTVVVHLAAATGKARREAFLAVNVRGTERLVQESARRGVHGFLLASTIAVHFRNSDHYHYAQSKRAAEEVVRASGLRHIVVRPTIVAGEDGAVWRKLLGLGRARPLIVPGDGRARVQPVHVDDVAACIAALVRHDHFTNDALDLGGPEVLSMEELLVRIHRIHRGSDPRVLHVPVGALAAVLARVERGLGPVLPVSAGQLTPFLQDSIAREGGPVPGCEPATTVDAMIRGAAHGA